MDTAAKSDELHRRCLWIDWLQQWSNVWFKWEAQSQKRLRGWTERNKFVWVCPTGMGPWRKPRTRWKAYLLQMAWKHVCCPRWAGGDLWGGGGGCLCSDWRFKTPASSVLFSKIKVGWKRFNLLELVGGWVGRSEIQQFKNSQWIFVCKPIIIHILILSVECKLEWICMNVHAPYCVPFPSNNNCALCIIITVSPLRLKTTAERWALSDRKKPFWSAARAHLECSDKLMCLVTTIRHLQFCTTQSGLSKEMFTDGEWEMHQNSRCNRSHTVHKHSYTTGSTSNSLQHPQLPGWGWAATHLVDV